MALGLKLSEAASSETTSEEPLETRIKELEDNLAELASTQARVDNFSKISNAIAVVLVAPAIALAGHFVQNGIKSREQEAKQRELDFKAIEISVGILQGEPLKDYDLRRWAATNISQLNPRNPLNAKATEQIIERPLSLGPNEVQETQPLKYIEPIGELGTAEAIDVLSWNLKRLSPDNPQGIQNVAELLARMQVDITVLQEVGPGVGSRLVESLEREGFLYALVEGPNRIGGQGMSLLFRPDQFEVELQSLSGSPLSSQFENVKVDGQSAFTYLPIVVTLAQKGKSSPPLSIIGVHLKSQYGGAERTAPRRVASSQAILNVARELEKNHGGSVMVIGTFNNSIASNDFAPLINNEDVVSLTKEIEEAGGATYVKPPFGPLMLDHVVVLDGARTPSDFNAQVIELDEFVSQYADTVSDHLPILARVK